MVARPNNRRRIGIRELRDHLSEIVREVRDDDLSVDVTLHGDVVAELQRTGKSSESIFARLSTETPEARELRIAEMERKGRLWRIERRKNTLERRATLARELGESWPSDVTATDAVREDRAPR